ncbi:MAG: flagellin [Magnetococcales bacterium]|nr:flagellin [Magnetococcales bacterium]
MAITIQNSASQGLIHSTSQVQKSLNETFQKLSTGLKVDQAQDNAALLAIADRFSTQVRGYNQAIQNANDGVSMVQVADAGLAQIQDGQVRLQELAIQSANATLNDSDRQALQTEANQIQEQIDSIIADTNFNGIDVLASNTPVNLQTGTGEGDVTSINFQDFSNAFTSVDISTQAGAQNAISSLETDMETVSQARSELGAVQSGLESTLNNLGSTVEALTAAKSRVEDADMAQAMLDKTSQDIRSQANIALLVQANQASERVMDLL